MYDRMFQRLRQGRSYRGIPAGDIHHKWEINASENLDGKLSGSVFVGARGPGRPRLHSCGALPFPAPDLPAASSWSWDDFRTNPYQPMDLCNFSNWQANWPLHIPGVAVSKKTSKSYIRKSRSGSFQCAKKTSVYFCILLSRDGNAFAQLCFNVSESFFGRRRSSFESQENRLFHLEDSHL